MARPDNPIDPSSPYAYAATSLRAIRERGGNPPFKKLARDTHYSIAALSQAASGKVRPTLRLYTAFAVACVGGDPEGWEAQWRTEIALDERRHPPTAATGSPETNRPGREVACSEPNPAEARTPQQFRTCLRKLKRWSGASLNQMCRSEADRGNNISRTVLGDAYRQHTLPGLATTVAFVRACLAVAAADREIPTARTGIHDWINAWADVDTAYRTTREAPGRPRPAPNPSRDSGPDALMQSPSAEARDPGRPFGPIAVDISPAERALAEALRALFRTVGAPMSRIAYALGADKGTLSRYLKGTRVPPWEFVDALIHQADLNSGHRITNNHIEALRSLHREALAVRNPKGAELHRLKEALHATESALHFAHEQATEEIMRLTALLAEFGAQARQARPHGGPPRRVLEQGAVNPGAHRRKGGGPRPGASRPGEEGPYGIYGEDDPETDDRTPDADNRDQAVSTTDRRRR